MSGYAALTRPTCRRNGAPERMADRNDSQDHYETLLYGEGRL
jgi:hypothetical protein